jgi:hypothetical protein
MSRKLVCGVLVVTAVQAVVAAEGSFKVVVDSANVSIMDGDRSILRYRYADVPFKPYVDELRTPNGVQVLRDAPHDHLHHHGLMFAVAVDGVNFWEEKETSGRQKHIRFTDVGLGDALGQQYTSFTERIDWIEPAKGEVLLHEARTISIGCQKGLAFTIANWSSKLTLPKGKQSAELTGSNYFGLGARFLQSMDPTAQFFTPEGKITVKGLHTTKSKWCAMTASEGNKDVTFTMFEAPNLKPRSVTWFTMAEPFAYLAATPALDQKPMTIKAGESVTFHYVIGLRDGHAKPEALADFYSSVVCAKQTAEPIGKMRMR